MKRSKLLDKNFVDKVFYENMYSERKQIMDILRQTHLTQLAPGFVHKQIVSYSTYAPWETDLPFRNTYSAIGNFTCVDEYKCFELWQLTKQLNEKEGDVI